MQEPTIGLSPASQAGAVTPVSAPRPPKIEQKSPGIAICHEVLLLIYKCIPCRHCKCYALLRDSWGDHIHSRLYNFVRHIHVLENVRWLHKIADLIPFSSSSSYMWWQFQHIIKPLVPKLRVECNQVTSWARFNQWALGWILPSGTLAVPTSTSLNPLAPRISIHMGDLFVACCSSLGVICFRLEYIMKQQHLPPVSWVLHFEAWASLKLVPTLPCILDPGGRQLMATDDNKRALTASE